jgi:lysophospholipase L1-like esterase
MKNALRLVSAIALMVSAAGAADAQVRILGRSELNQTGGFALHWPSGGFETRLNGKLLTATIEDFGDNWLNVEVDGVVSRIDLRPGVSTYTLFSGPAGPHTVRVTRRTGAPAGPIRVHDIHADGTLQAPAAPERRILVIGDSIASGYGVEGIDQTCSYTHATQNADLAYPALLARTFGADLHSISVDGRGLVRNYAGDDPSMDLVAWRMAPESTPRWPTTAYEPAVVVINLGTSDFSEGDPGDGFDNAYIGLLQKLRAAYPVARIYAVFGPMLDGKSYEAARASINGAVEDRRLHRDTRVSFVEFPSAIEGRRYGCDWHPGQDAHRAMASRLEDRIQKDLGWTPRAQGKPVRVWSSSAGAAAAHLDLVPVAE